MRGPNPLRRLLTKQFATTKTFEPPSTAAGPECPSAAPGKRKTTDWLRVFVLAGLVGVVAGGVVSSCAVTDTDYCLTNAQCVMAGIDAGSAPLVCHPTRHICVAKLINGCISDADCSDPTLPRCDTDESVCKSCQVGSNSDKSCAQRADGRKLCVSTADSSGSLCVACQANTDCHDPAAPICDGQTCRGCISHQDCEGTLVCDNGTSCTDSQVCIQNGDLPGGMVGRCAQNGASSGGRVIYVNNTMAKVDSNTGTDPTVPLFTLKDALIKAHDSGRRFIRVVGTLDALGTTADVIIQDAYVFIGAPVKNAKNPMGMAVVMGRNTMFQVGNGGALTLDQLSLRQNSAALNGNSVNCGGSATPLPSLTMRRCIVSGSTLPGMAMANTAAVSISNCNTTLDGNVIGLTNTADLANSMAGVNGTGLQLTDNSSVAATYLVQNNIIAGNAGNGVELSATGRGLGKFIFRFNTIVFNGRGQMGTVPGISCPSVTSSFEFSRSIVLNNATVGGSQFSQGSFCNLKDVVVNPDEMGTTSTTVIKAAVDLSPDFRLHAGADKSACCIDKISAVGTEILPSTDVDGVARPFNGKWDIGASEYKP